MKPVLKVNHSLPFQVWQHVGDPREEVAWHCDTLETAKACAERARRMKGASGAAWNGRVTIRDMRKHCGPSKAEMAKMREILEVEFKETLDGSIIIHAAEMVRYVGSTEDAARRMLKAAGITAAEVGKCLEQWPEDVERIKDLVR